ncbi:hypothetical protein KEJ26_04085 [Candidatus Bathyarchaeota archaeon]|nr:hypothetical protein [Candidatus Bathyarchaeota archaeon]
MKEGGIIELSASVAIFVLIILVATVATNAEIGKENLCLTMRIGHGIDEAQTIMQKYSYIDASSGNSYPILDLDKASSHLIIKQTGDRMISVKSATSVEVTLPILVHSRGQIIVRLIKLGEKNERLPFND